MRPFFLLQNKTWRGATRPSMFYSMFHSVIFWSLRRVEATC